jgi:hypothetical protein
VLLLHERPQEVNLQTRSLIVGRPSSRELDFGPPVFSLIELESSSSPFNALGQFNMHTDVSSHVNPADRKICILLTRNYRLVSGEKTRIWRRPRVAAIFVCPQCIGLSGDVPATLLRSPGSLLHPFACQRNKPWQLRTTWYMYTAFRRHDHSSGHILSEPLWIFLQTRSLHRVNLQIMEWSQGQAK